MNLSASNKNNARVSIGTTSVEQRALDIFEETIVST